MCVRFVNLVCKCLIWRCLVSLQTQEKRRERESEWVPVLFPYRRYCSRVYFSHFALIWQTWRLLWKGGFVKKKTDEQKWLLKYNSWEIRSSNQPTFKILNVTQKPTPSKSVYKSKCLVNNGQQGSRGGRGD